MCCVDNNMDSSAPMQFSQLEKWFKAVSNPFTESTTSQQRTLLWRTFLCMDGHTDNSSVVLVSQPNHSTTITNNNPRTHQAFLTSHESDAGSNPALETALIYSP